MNDERLTALGDTPGSDGCGCTRVMLEQERDWQRTRGEAYDDLVVLGRCPHGVDLDREFCPKGCRV
ncbi:MAG: hypothetical protein K0S82_77 [Gaiellaceae bacterium]|jgi:hypothetical protein|nr:hypothetical protein [Gaiellaceae bacterium]